MTTIHNIGIVIQSGSAASEAQQIKHHQTDPSHIAASHQPAKNVIEQTSVQETGNPEKTDFKDRQEEGRHSSSDEHRQSNEIARKPDEEKDPDSTGFLIDTVI